MSLQHNGRPTSAGNRAQRQAPDEHNCSSGETNAALAAISDAAPDTDAGADTLTHTPLQSSDGAAIRVLLIDDDPQQVHLLTHLLDNWPGARFQVEAATTLAHGLSRISEGGLDLVLLDLSLPDSAGFETFRTVAAAAPELAVIVLSGLDDVALAVRVVHEGAQDYFVKGEVDARVLARAMRYAVERKRLELAHQHAEQALRTSQEQFRALAARRDQAREDDRARIARELHDQVGQFLTGLRMDIAWINGQFAQDNPPLARKTREMTELVDSSIELVRGICADLRPRMIDDFGLDAVVAWQAKRFQKRSGIACEFVYVGQTDLRGPRALAVFRILQEALANVTRHSRATKVEITMNSTDGACELEVSDNGCGIDPERLNDIASLGLIGMRERAQAAGCAINLASELGKGTTLTVRMALSEGAGT
jgi:signal transduction histidine kinase